MTVEVEESSPLVLKVSGELDAHSAEGVPAEFGRLIDGAREVTLDLSGVSFLDSTGLRPLLDLDERLRRRGGRLQIRNPSSTVRRVLEIADLVEHFGLGD